MDVSRLMILLKEAWSRARDEGVGVMEDFIGKPFTATTMSELNYLVNAPLESINRELREELGIELYVNTLPQIEDKGWKSHNIFALTATQWLILIEYASMNAQSVIGQGVSTFTDDGSTNMAVVTGATSGLGNGSGIDPNAGVDGKCSVSYRGEENLWGNIWTWLDAINIYNDKASGVYNAFVKPYGECKDDTTADGYKALDFNIATGEGYISGFGYDEDHPDLFLCAEHNGASNLPVGDYYWNNNDGFRVAILGGTWADGALCGAWCLSLSNASSTRYRRIGGRLLYVPQTKISA